MKKPLTTLLLLLSATANVACSVKANETAYSSNYKDYHLIAMKGCKVIQYQSLTKEQFARFKEMDQQRLVLEQLEEPINAIEADIDKYTAELEAATEKYVEHKGDTIIIHKEKLQEHKKASEKFRHFMDGHRAKFDKLSQEADEFRRLHERFESSLGDSIKQLDYNNLTVTGPGLKKHTCLSS